MDKKFSKSSIVDRRIFSENFFKNNFDEKFLHEKDVALKPLDFSEVERLSKQLDEKEENVIKINNDINNNTNKNNENKINNEQINKTQYSKFNSNCLVVYDKITLNDEEDYLSKLIKEVMLKED